MIEQLHDDIVKQIVPPVYKYTADVGNHSVRFKLDRSIDTSHIDTTDPIASILLNNCIHVRVDSENSVCRIAAYCSSHKHVVLDHISRYFRHFLRENMKQKNPKATRLYKWVQQFMGAHEGPEGSDDEYIMLYKYLYTNIDRAGHADRAVHIKNGISILNTFRLKYEAKGYKVEARRGRRHGRNRW